MTMTGPSTPQLNNEYFRKPILFFLSYVNICWKSLFFNIIRVWVEFETLKYLLSLVNICWRQLTSDADR